MMRAGEPTTWWANLSTTDPRAVKSVSIYVVVILLIVLTPTILLPSLLGYPRFELRGGTLTVRTLTQRYVFSPNTATTAEAMWLTRTTSRGCRGRFETSGRSFIRTFAGCEGRAVVFSRNGVRYGVTPDDPEKFLAAWRAGETATFRRAP